VKALFRRVSTSFYRGTRVEPGHIYRSGSTRAEGCEKRLSPNVECARFEAAS
jgi:hypothetical protein